MALPVDSPAFRDALIVLGSAGLVIPAFHRLRVSPVIGFILVGALVGPHGLGRLIPSYPWLRYVAIEHPESLNTLAEVGIILLLFMIGLELSFARLRQMRSLVFGLGATELLLPATVIGTSLVLLGYALPGAVALGFALSLSSTALVLQGLPTGRGVGRFALAMLLFEDVALVPILFLLNAMSAGGDHGTAEMVRTLVQGAIAIALILIIGRFALRPMFRQAARTKSPELFLAAALVVVIGASMLTAIAGLSPIMGALIAGVLIAETEYRRQVEVTVDPFKGLALGIFLLTIGMSLDLEAVMAQPLRLLGTVALLVGIKAIIIAALLGVSGAGRGVTLRAALLMGSTSETGLIVLSAAVAAGLVSRADGGFWQIVIALGLTITPLLARPGRWMEVRADARDILITPIEPIENDAEPRVVIAGFGRVGRLVADMLDRHEKPYVAVDSDIESVIEARGEGRPAVFGDTSRIEMIERLQLDRASALVLTMDDPVGILSVVRAVRGAHPRLCIVARARDANHAAALYRAGATDAVPETLESSLQLSEALLVALGVPMGPVIASIHDKRAALREAIMNQGETHREPPLRRRRLRDAAPS